MAVARRNRRLILGLTAGLVAYALLGFFLAPWLVNKVAIEGVREAYGAELRIGKIAINPFVLSLRIDGLEMDHPGGAPFVRIQRIFVNFQLSSLFRWALTFRTLQVDEPEIFIARDEAGNLNLAFLLDGGDAPPEENSDLPGSAPVRLLIEEFAINSAVTHWYDEVPAEPVETTFGPVNVTVADLNTLPQREAQQDVVITTESNGTFGWSGTLQLVPLRSEGHATVTGSHTRLLSAYLRHQTGFDILRGNADIGFDYSLDTTADGSLKAAVNNFELTLSELLVRTFVVATGGDPLNDRDVFEVPSITLSGGTLRWPEQVVSLASISVNDASVSLYRSASGELNILPASIPADELENSAPATGKSPWAISLDRFELNRMTIGFIDDSVEPPADIGVEQLNLVVTDINNAEGASFPTTLSSQTRVGGAIGANGSVTVLPQLDVSLDFEIADISLGLLHPYLKSLADVSLDSGMFNMTGRMHSGVDDTLLLNGDISIVDFLITETDGGSRLGSWKRLVMSTFSLDLDARLLTIAEVRMHQPYADIFIAEDGSANLGRVEKGVQTARNEETELAVSVTNLPDPEVGADEKPVMDITIGRVILIDAAANFADFSLPLPFDAKIEKLNGSLTTISSSSSEPSEISLEGKVDEYGSVTVSGTVTPLALALNTDLEVEFLNVGVPKFSAYTIPFAGREIASGRLDLDLGYKVTNGALVGENKIVLRELELGQEVPHPGAMSLPLGLAIALLKDSSGKIDIDLPVQGNVDDPDFRYGRVVLKALANLIVKIVASPFTLLGKLIGVEPDELEYINFPAGRSNLTPPELERAQKLAQALILRPELALVLPKVTDLEQDGLALRTLRFDEMLEQRISADKGGNESYSEQRRAALEQLFAEQPPGNVPPDALAAMRARFTASITDESGRAAEKFDSVAYSAELRHQLIEIQALSEDELAALGSQRAESVRHAIVLIDSGLQDRIVLGEQEQISTKSDEDIRVKVRLTTGGASPGMSADKLPNE
ncbi:MAG: DUF748 domain-containing protein [Xanthomonadales bacterium]|nr:DUF748 domain-containing protein [Xanthomonadales bacterium]